MGNDALRLCTVAMRGPEGVLAAAWHCGSPWQLCERVLVPFAGRTRGAMTRTGVICSHGAGDCGLSSALFNLIGLCGSALPPSGDASPPSSALGESATRPSKRAPPPLPGLCHSATPPPLPGLCNSTASLTADPLAEGNPLAEGKCRSCTSSQECGSSTSVSGRSGPSASSTARCRLCEVERTTCCLEGDMLWLRPHIGLPGASGSMDCSLSSMFAEERNFSFEFWFTARCHGLGVSVRCGSPATA